ncbi:hypothetical protein A3844_06085 [Paenibacillus helianthi]|uniref:Uncharacterized protein n=1 Tax=Paenibacillus helianthi TaxID=1349432 RepID=A0ABX3EVU6_9BACL|nr:hypothetical protein [Paenibacillus helianthi]OKP89548.1 hypothetical protein A3844_06085 [Paenibacillus helianthi]
MKSTFGIFTKAQGEVVFGRMRATLVNDETDPNHPDHPASPNRPRVDQREPGYTNPALGDEGKGKIGRWQTVNLDSLESVIDQIIEQYLRDKSWYSTVRCREALWNMYRRLAWWVKQQVDPNRSDYQRALLLIKDCIRHILEEAQDPELAHNVSLPTCPAPFYFPFKADYLNHFDGKDVERTLFDMTDLPKSDDFHGLFRYVSSVEDQEWEIIHAVGANEMTGNENIMKLSLAKLLPGNSSKITFNWRWKRMGYISFKYWASAANGNGLNFFINNNQVGGEWSAGTGWQEVKFNVAPGQTYKFDWLVRSQVGENFGQNAVYIKDVKCIEVIRSLGGETPPDFDTLDSDAYGIPGFDWITNSKSSVVRTHFNGVVIDEQRARTLRYHLDNECDGVVRFTYLMNSGQPGLESESFGMFSDNLQDRIQMSQGKHGSSVQAEHGDEWVLDGTSSSTQTNQAKIIYSLIVGDKCTVNTIGAVEMFCPPLEIDHYEDSLVQTLGGTGWNQTGNLHWQALDGSYRIDNPTEGSGQIQTNVYLEDDGWFEFSFDHSLRPSERLEALVDGEIVFESGNINSGNNILIPLKPGSHIVSFRLTDEYTEEGITSIIGRDYSYGSATKGDPFTTTGPFRSGFTIVRDWEMSNAGASTDQNGSRISYMVKLNPGASFYVEELLRLSAPVNASASSEVFKELFNKTDGSYDSHITMTPNWEWQDILSPPQGDGVYKVEGKDGTENTITLSGVPLSNDGFVEFEYGGMFGPKENLILVIDGATVWADSHSDSSSKGTKVRVPVSAGDHIYKWIYKDLGGTVYTDPNTGGGEVDSGEVRYPAGVFSQPVGYSQSDWTLLTDRHTRLRSGGTNFNPGAFSQASGTNGGTITRNISFNNFAEVKFDESLTIMAGTAIPQASQKKPVTVKLSPINGILDESKEYYYITLKQMDFLNVAGWASESFYTHGTIELDFKYLTYLVDPTGIKIDDDKNGRNMSGLNTDHRGEFSAYIVPEVGGFDEGIEINFHIAENVGTERFPESINNWSQAKDCSRKIKVSPGKYYIYFKLYDAVHDYDVDAKERYYYAAFKNVRVNVTTAPTVIYNTWDDTEVKVDLIDVSDWSIIDSHTYGTNGAKSRSVAVSFDKMNMQPGHAYQVRYTLLQGKGTKGGLYDNGGTMQLKNGRFLETWDDYCHDRNGKYYLPGSSPYPPPTPPSTHSLPKADSSCWVDVIKLYESNKPICPGTGLDVRVTRGGSLLSHNIYSTPGQQPVKINLMNNTTTTQEYEITMTFLAGCSGDRASLYKGNFKLKDKSIIEPSYAQISSFQATNHKPIWMGGCYTSKMHIKVYNDAGTLVYSQDFMGEGLHSFDVSKLPFSPYSKYRVEVETEQGGQISAVTGKQYLTTFKLVDFKAFEIWALIPDPFQGKLEFFVDDVLFDTYTSPGGFYDVSYPVPKGAHEFKWVFTELGNGYSWDYCDIDLLELTNWVCDRVRVTPYCDKGGGDKCVEELIKCLLKMWRDRPKACTIGKKIWLFT